MHHLQPAKRDIDELGRILGLLIRVNEAAIERDDEQ